MSDNRKLKPLRLFAIINAKGELARVYRGDTDNPWMIKAGEILAKDTSMLLAGDKIIELKPTENVEVFY